MDKWISTSRTIQSSQGHSILQEDSCSTFYETNLLADQSNPSQETCTTPLLTFSNTGMWEIFPWLPSRNGNADAANIFGDDPTKQIKLVFNFTSTVTKLKHQTWKVLKILIKQFSNLFPPLHMRGHNQEDWSYFTWNQVSDKLSFLTTQPEWEAIWVSGSHSLFVQPFLLWLNTCDIDDRIAYSHDGSSLMLRERKRESPWKGITILSKGCQSHNWCTNKSENAGVWQDRIQ